MSQEQNNNQKPKQDSNAFTNHIIHNMNNMISKILNPAELLLIAVKSNNIDKDKFAKYLSYIVDTSLEISSLTKLLQEISKLESGKTKVSLSNVNAVQILKETCTSLFEEAAKKQIKISSSE